MRFAASIHLAAQIPPVARHTCRCAEKHRLLEDLPANLAMTLSIAMNRQPMGCIHRISHTGHASHTLSDRDGGWGGGRV